MSTPQKIVAGIATAFFFLTLVCAPWTVEMSSSHLRVISPIWDAPALGREQRLDFSVVAAEWIGIAVMGSIGFLIFKRDSKPKPTSL
ncbi:MAG TPA: hypothetical protein VNT99_03610 [Methylomirabilota bacterium]|nr:hypothetical protein [Methylomirabilota bacterium]